MRNKWTSSKEKCRGLLGHTLKHRAVDEERMLENFGIQDLRRRSASCVDMKKTEGAHFERLEQKFMKSRLWGIKECFSPDVRVQGGAIAWFQHGRWGDGLEEGRESGEKVTESSQNDAPCRLTPSEKSISFSICTNPSGKVRGSR
jgi:hypothetical protein